MKRIAIVEDEKIYSDYLIQLINEYFKDKNQEYQYEVFDNGLKFLESDVNSFNVVLMDIELPHENGMNISYDLRKINKDIQIIFATNVAQFALKGYEVDAIGYLLKPVNKKILFIYLDKAFKKIEEQNNSFILINVDDGIKKLSLNELYYIEVIDHLLYFHTSDGIITIRKAMKDVEIELKDKGFIRSNNCYLVNLKFIKKITNNSLFINNEELQLSRNKRKEVLISLNEYIGRNL